MKVVINECYGGFGLSPLAIKRYAELNGKECYFFKLSLTEDNNKSITLEEANKEFCWVAYSVPNPEDYKLNKRDEDGLYKSANKRAGKISLSYRDIKRNDKNLIKLVSELGDKANGKCAKLKIVKIPDNVEYEIEEYDGIEWISEKHRRWE